MKITTVIGARPQFIKASLLSRRFSSHGVHERILHTGQHYDENMSSVFFSELEIPEPAKNLGIGGTGHGDQTGEMLASIERDLQENRPDALLVYGDTNSTLAGSLAAAKLHIPVIHIEAGLRSFDKQMPEEINRVLTDHISSLLLCPTSTSITNLENEGIKDGVHLVGDVMQSVLEDLAPLASKNSEVIPRLKLNDKDFYLATVHRAENTDNIDRLCSIMDTLSSFNCPVVMPLHPRTKKKLHDWGWRKDDNSSLIFIEPVGYMDMLSLIDGAKIVLTDSGGLQKESVWMSTPCVTMRDTTEWVETVESGWNILTGAEPQLIKEAVEKFEVNHSLGAMKNINISPEKLINLIKSNYYE